MNYSNKEVAKLIKDAIKNKKHLTLITDKSNLSTEERIKRSLCKHFVQFANSRRMMIKDMSKLTNIPVTRLSEITNYKIKKFTVDQLIKNLTLLAEHDPQIKEYLVFLVQAADLPALKVTKTKKLIKEIKQASAVYQ